MGKNIFVVGGGGREHALAWKLTQSTRLGNLYVAPGNGGTRTLAENVAISAGDIGGLLHFAEKRQIDLTIVGPDDPLALGIVDAFRACGLPIFGPSLMAARIEASKSFAKRLLLAKRIPTAAFRVFTRHDEALTYLKQQRLPIVVKASGLAFGKGVVICRSPEEAEEALRKIMVEKKYGEAGAEVVIEEFLEGQEISLHALSDGWTSKLLPPAQDHKPINDGDQGPNTGGMGTYAPVPWLSNHELQKMQRAIVDRTLSAMRRSGSPFVGCLYPGLIMTAEGPKVLEFNARFGDPETQSYMRLLKSDLIEVCEACANGKLANLKLEWHPGFAVCVVLASGGYPGKYCKGLPIQGIAKAERNSGVIVFHAGTALDGGLVTAGGRVLGVTAVGATLQTALDSAYEAIRYISFDGMHYRKDIGAKTLSR